MNILNLYAGIGGNRKEWGNDHDITAVEYDPEIAKIYTKHFPKDEVIITDAHEYLIKHYKEFDFIWSSPPCPTHSRLTSALKGWGIVRYPDMTLYQEIIFLKHFFEGKFVVENVVSYYEPLIQPIIFCRHYFWTNFLILPKDIDDPTTGMIGNGAGVKKFQDLLGFNVSGFRGQQIKKRQLLRNCVNPELGKHILECAIGKITREKSNQPELFV